MIFILFVHAILIVLLPTQVFGKIYIPTTSSYKVNNHETVDKPYDITWDLSDSSVIDALRYRDDLLRVEKNKRASNIQVTIRGRARTYGGYFLDCGKVKDPYKYYEVYPREILFEIAINSVNDNETFVKIKFKGVAGGWEGKNSAFIYPLDDNLNATCISTGEYEDNFLSNLRHQVDVIKLREKKARQAEEKHLKEKLKAEQRKQKEEKLRLAIELENQKREQERIKRKKERQEKRESFLKDYLPKCNGMVLSFVNFVLGNNPYADKGKCITLVGRNFQMTSEKTGIFRVGGPSELAYIEFSKTFRGSLIYAIAKVKGVYTYKTVRGTYNNVPHFSIVKELSAEE